MSSILRSFFLRVLDKKINSSAKFVEVLTDLQYLLSKYPDNPDILSNYFICLRNYHEFITNEQSNYGAIVFPSISPPIYRLPIQLRTDVFAFTGAIRFCLSSTILDIPAVILWNFMNVSIISNDSSLAYSLSTYIFDKYLNQLDYFFDDFLSPAFQDNDKSCLTNFIATLWILALSSESEVHLNNFHQLYLFFLDLDYSISPRESETFHRLSRVQGQIYANNRKEVQKFYQSLIFNDAMDLQQYSNTIISLGPTKSGELNYLFASSIIINLLTESHDHSHIAHLLTTALSSIQNICYKQLLATILDVVQPNNDLDVIIPSENKLAYSYIPSFNVSIYDICFDVDHIYIVECGYTSFLRCINTTNGKTTQHQLPETYCHDSICDNNKLYLAGFRNFRVSVFSLTTGTLKHCMFDPSINPISLGKYADQIICLDYISGRLYEIHNTPKLFPFQFTYDPEIDSLFHSLSVYNTQIAVLSKNPGSYAIHIFNMSNKEYIRYPIKYKDLDPFSIEFIDDINILIADYNNGVLIYNTLSKSFAYSLQLPHCTDATFSNGEIFAVSCHSPAVFTCSL